jgi:thiamine pyrophosphokinase
MTGSTSVPVWPTAIVFAGSDPVSGALLDRLPNGAGVIAADSGLHVANTLGLYVDLLVGDLDSTDASLVDAAVARGTTVERHPAEKDATDLELALEAARARGAEHITVVGGAGGRLDHLLANMLLLASPRFADVEIDAWPGEAHVAVVQGGRPPHGITGSSGSIVTLLPAGGDATGITTTGLQYPLGRETLPRGTSRGVSNVLVGEAASVVLEHGTLLAVQPFAARIPGGAA